MVFDKRLRTALLDAGIAVGLVASLVIVFKLDRGINGGSVLRGVKKHETLLGSVYELRTAAKRDELVVGLGGSLASERAVQAGLDWLVRHQAADGAWSGASLGPTRSHPRSRCEKAGPACTVPGGDYVMAQTGLALLALQAAGHYDFNAGRYSGQVARGLEWLTTHQRPDGALVGPMSWRAQSFGRDYMYEHAIATFALAEACAVRKAMGQGPDERLDRSTRQAIQFIENQQHDDGGWRYSPNRKSGSDTSVSGWAMLALKSALEADLPVDRETVYRTRDFFEKCERPDGRTGYVGNHVGVDSLTGVGMLVHIFLLKEPNSDLVKKAAPYLADQTETYGRKIRAGDAEFYTLYNVTLALYQVGGSPWERWNRVIRDAVVANQTGGRLCNRGSWDPGSTHGGGSGGRIYSTALATLMLEVYYRYARTSERSP